MRHRSYEEACREHRWVVPERYNIAADVCDRHPREQLAMIHEHYSGDGAGGRLGRAAGPRQPAANVLASLGVERGDRVAVVLPPTPETAAVFFATWKLGALLLVDVGALRRRGDPPPPRGLRAQGARHRRRQRGPLPGGVVPQVLVLDEHTFDGVPTQFETLDTAADDPAQLYYTSGTTGLAKGIVHAHRYLLGARGVRLLPRRAPGERFHGMGEWAWAAGICPLLGPWRLGAVQCVYQREGGFDPHKQLAFLSRHAVTQRLRHADGDSLDDVDQRRAHALPAALSHRVLGR